ncbi:protein containing Uncharacterized protein family UPF0004 [mine drainage metagenome]|uniref:Protein containing Uncharacterized protein family UPF0004 n=1 Tax=mine drainage metagenome TaxID=410659 RepID=T1CJZ3_9ZZZZ
MVDDRCEMPKRVYIETQGCQMNVYDSGKLLEILEESLGYLPAGTPEDATLFGPEYLFGARKGL